GPVDRAGGQRGPVRGGDPGVEDLVAGPHGDHHRFADRIDGFADQLGEDSAPLPATEHRQTITRPPWRSRTLSSGAPRPARPPDQGGAAAGGGPSATTRGRSRP